MKKYLITSPEFYASNLATFRKTLRTQIQKHTPDFALYRDKESEKYKELAQNFIVVCRDFKELKSFLHSDVDLAKSLGAAGVHLTSMEFDKIEYALSLGLEVIVSTHTHKEVLKAQSLGANYVTYSPIFASPNKGEPKGIDDLKELLKKCSIKVFALGGIVTDEHIEAIRKTQAFGFASIRYFYSVLHVGIK